MKNSPKEKSKFCMHINMYHFLKRLFKNRIVQASIIVFLSTVTALLIGEAIIYFLYKDKIANFPRYVSDAQYNDFRIRRHVPNAQYWHKSANGKWKFIINSKGFRDIREYEHQKPQGVFRILVLGDSFTVGWEVQQDETYASVMERYLKENGLNAEVINAGIQGYSTAEELVFLEQEGVKYQPDVVVLGFFHNDLDDNIRANLYRFENNELVLHNKEYLPAIGIRNFLNSFWVYRWLSENSHLHNYMNNVLTVFVKKRKIEKNWASTNIGEAQASNSPITTKDYKELLAIALVERIYSIAQDLEAYFILLDISTSNLEPSFPWREVTNPQNVSDVYVNSALLLRDYQELIELYRAHGHWSEFSHRIAGIKLAKIILERFEVD